MVEASLSWSLDKQADVSFSNLQSLCGFEGPEKLLEIWFSSTSIPDIPFHETPPYSNASDSGSDFELSMERSPLSIKNGLRQVPKEVWDDMLDIVKCKVLDHIENEFAEAFLLSESSMFVYPHKLILKTCGTTTLLHAVPRILEIARELAGLDRIDAFFYSRKAFFFPEKQIAPHGQWSDEVSYLDRMFSKKNFRTSGYILGPTNGDHWCIYSAVPLEGFNAHSQLNPKDITLEIMITGLDKIKAKNFFRLGNELNENEGWEFKAAERMFNASGLCNIYPPTDSIISHYSFSPCGYSLNGLIGPYYWTIHVTPEDICSYASFETNAPMEFVQKSGGITGLIHHVLDSFGGDQVDMSIFEKKEVSQCWKKGPQRSSNMLVNDVDKVSDAMPDYHGSEAVWYDLGGWELGFWQFERKNNDSHVKTDFTWEYESPPKDR